MKSTAKQIANIASQQLNFRKGKRHDLRASVDSACKYLKCRATERVRSSAVAHLRSMGWLPAHTSTTGDTA